jgi:hypothetical protein
MPRTRMPDQSAPFSPDETRPLRHVAHHAHHRHSRHEGDEAIAAVRLEKEISLVNIPAPPTGRHTYHDTGDPSPSPPPDMPRQHQPSSVRKGTGCTESHQRPPYHATPTEYLTRDASPSDMVYRHAHAHHQATWRVAHHCGATPAHAARSSTPPNSRLPRPRRTCPMGRQRTTPA